MSTSSGPSSAKPKPSKAQSTETSGTENNSSQTANSPQEANSRQEAHSQEPKKRTRKSRISPNLHPEGTLRVRYRIRFAKTDLLRWISHRDLSNLWERIGRRAGLPFSMTEGFHPQPRLMFPSALPLGIESLDEVVDLELDQEWDAQRLLESLRQDEQPGLTIHSATRVDLTDGKAQLAGREYRVTLPEDFVSDEADQVHAEIKKLKQQDTIETDRKGKTIVTHVPTQIPVLELQADQLVARMINSESASLKIHEVLELLGIGDWPDRGATIIRTRTYLKGKVDSG